MTEKTAQDVELEKLENSPAGELQKKLDEELTLQRVADVEVILLQQELDRQIEKKKEQGREDEIKCSTVPEYVATFFHSGSAGITAQGQLANLGLSILSTPEGIEYLRKRFPIEEG